jgi:hypothetical protein
MVAENSEASFPIEARHEPSKPAASRRRAVRRFDEQLSDAPLAPRSKKLALHGFDDRRADTGPARE